jgi:hypothetical protein
MDEINMGPVNLPLPKDAEEDDPLAIHLNPAEADNPKKAAEKLMDAMGVEVTPEQVEKAQAEWNDNPAIAATAELLNDAWNEYLRKCREFLDTSQLTDKEQKRLAIANSLACTQTMMKRLAPLLGGFNKVLEALLGGMAWGVMCKEKREADE